MTAQIETDEVEIEAVPEVISLGQHLKNAREQMGLTIQGVADQLNLKPGIIEGIEKGEFDTDISPTFTRGYLRSYARLVNADCDWVLAQFDELDVARQQYFKMQSFSQRTNAEAHNNMLMWISGLIAVVMMSLFVMWWFQKGESLLPDTSSTTINATAETAEQAPLLSESTDQAPVVETDVTTTADPADTQTELALPEVDAVSDMTQETTQASVSDTISADNAQTDSAPVVISETVTDAATDTMTVAQSQLLETVSTTLPVIADPSETAPLDSLTFTFDGDCWVKVIDATNEVLAIGIKRAGKHMPLTGVAPFEVILGAPHVVSISYQGEPLDTSGFDKGQTARFKVPFDSSPSN